MIALPARLLNAITLIVLFAGALVVNLGTSGKSPTLWLDTLADQQSVDSCIADNACTGMGMTTSLPGFVAALGWIEFRTFAQWIGLGLDGTFLIMQIARAFAVVLVFWVASQLGGALAGAVAVVLALTAFGEFGVPAAALHNITPLFFLGAVLVLACSAVIKRPSAIAVILAALVGAVLANVHLSLVLIGASIVWVGLLAPSYRLERALGGAALFCAAAYGLAPLAWAGNFAALFQPHSGGAPAATPIHALPDLVRWSAFAALAWPLSLLSKAPRWVAYRRNAQGALAVLVPFLGAFLLAPLLGVDANEKYLSPLRAAAAVAAALPIGVAASALLSRLAPQRICAVIEAAVALAVALAIPFLPTGAPGGDERTPSFAELTTALRSLRDERGWTAVDLLQGVEANQRQLTGKALLQLVGADALEAPRTVGRTALMLDVAAQNVPAALPPNWQVLHRGDHRARLLVELSSRLDWRCMQVCTQPLGSAQASCAIGQWSVGPDLLPAVSALPAPGQDWRGTIRLRVPWRANANALAEERIFMPRDTNLCGGRIESDTDAAMHVAADRRHATIAANGGPLSPIEFAWDVGSSDCATWSYDALPPMVAAGLPADVELLESLMRDPDPQQMPQSADHRRQVRSDSVPEPGGASLDPSHTTTTVEAAEGETRRADLLPCQPLVMHPPQPWHRPPHVSPLEVALFKAGLQIAIVLAATLFGIAALTAERRTQAPRQL
ncbi:MAG: hypothetical protein ABI629_13795 [bacterium]